MKKLLLISLALSCLGLAYEADRVFVRGSNNYFAYHCTFIPDGNDISYTFQCDGVMKRVAVKATVPDPYASIYIADISETRIFELNGLPKEFNQYANYTDGFKGIQVGGDITIHIINCKKAVRVKITFYVER